MVAHLIKALLERNPKVEPGSIGDCVVGAGIPEGCQGMNIGRTSAVLAGLPDSVPGLTVSRYCSSGLQAIATAANQIASGIDDVILAGGVEQISMTKTNGDGLFNADIMAMSPGIYMPMGQTAEIVAQRYKVKREDQDQMALLSQQRTAAAQEAGLFKDEIIPMTVKWVQKNKETGEEKELEGTVDKDECNRPGTTIESLQSLAPVFDPEKGSVTAGNSSQLSDGSSMTLVMSAQKAEQLGLEPLAYFRGFAVAGCAPDEMGIGPVFAVPKLLEAKGLKLDDIDIIELNEAFASQAVYCRDTLGIDNDKLNVNGGSISIGHPYGMTGSRLVGHAARELQRRKQKYGLISMCIGGGQGAAGLIEAC
jgi:acetyl-CoA acyltransferase